MIAKIENGVVTQWPLAEHFLSHAHPNTSFSFPLNDETIAQYGFARFEYSDPATYDADFQEAREITPVLNGAVATQAWEIVEKYTAEEKAAKIAENQAAAAARAATEYQRQRAAEYPPVTDYLDGIVKGDQAQVQAYIDACLAVKAKYPKPSV
jgi:hypothetical protein